MKSALLFLCLLLPLCGSRAEVPLLFRQRNFNAAILAHAVNHFVALGERRAVEELSALAADSEPQEVSKASLALPKGVDLAEREGWVCRILFQPKERAPLRQPLYGALTLPYLSMHAKKWPLYPVAAFGKSYFVLAEGYALMGVPEAPKHYLDYCRNNGAFRKVFIPVPTRETARADALALRNSSGWKALQWKDTAYTLDELFVWSFVKAQADSIE